jgi:hypothetical protein
MFRRTVGGGHHRLTIAADTVRSSCSGAPSVVGTIG